jgi:hypothetical protein
MKYINWPWAASEFKATEELYHTGDDPLEMTNLAPSDGYANSLREMRGIYDRYVAQWKSEGVPYHRYPAFGVFFDRKESWEKKAEALDAQRKKKRGK